MEFDSSSGSTLDCDDAFSATTSGLLQTGMETGTMDGCVALSGAEEDVLVLEAGAFEELAEYECLLFFLSTLVGVGDFTRLLIDSTRFEDCCVSELATEAVA